MEKFEIFDEIPDQLGTPLKKSMLEIAFKIDDLNKLYNSERKFTEQAGESFFFDYVEMAQVRDDRVGDSIGNHTLIDISHEFLRRATIDIANQIADRFNREYGGQHVGVLKERNLQELQLSLLYNSDDGRHHIHRIGRQPNRYFQLKGEWRRREAEVSAERHLTWETVPIRIRALIASGFAPEAISVANGFLELVFRQMLASAVSTHPKEFALVHSRSIGYDMIRSILRKTLEKNENRERISKLLDLTDFAKNICEKRNAYMHGLTLLEHDFTRGVDLTREANSLLGFFVSYDPDDLLSSVEYFIRSKGSDLDANAIAYALSEIQLSTEVISPKISGVHK